jgi:hypothetical protein
VKHLSIELSESAVRFSVIENGAIKAYDYNFTDKKDYRYKEQLDDFLVQSDLKNSDFDETTVSWSSKRSCLIPANIFGESKPDSILKLCYGEDIPTNHIDYNRIPEHGMVNIYEIPLWVKSFFVIRYPRSVIQHEGSHLLRGIFAENTHKLKTTLVVYDQFVLITILKENKLEFYSVFDYTENEDIIYHTLFTLQQKGLNTEVGTLQIYTGVGSSINKIEELHSKFSAFTDLKSSTIIVNTDLITKSQQLCV